MSFITASTSRVILGDFALSGYLRKVGAEGVIAMLDTTVLTDAAETVIPGLKNAKVPIGGLLDSDATATGQNREIADRIGATTDDVFSWGPQGFTRGNPVMCASAQTASYPVMYDLTSVVAWTADLVADGMLDMGVSLLDLGALTANNTGTGVDNAGATANGGAGYLHVTAYSGFTSVAVKVQDSVNNSAWTDLVTFTSVTGRTSERVQVAAGATVKRYLRSLVTVTGSGSITMQVSFARR